VRVSQRHSWARCARAQSVVPIPALAACSVTVARSRSTVFTVTETSGELSPTLSVLPDGSSWP